MIGAQIDAIAGARITGPGAELLPDTGLFDVVLADGAIVDIAPAGALRLRGEVMQADGAFLLPGLWDHHVHVTQWALTGARLPLGGATSAYHAVDLMGAALIQADGRRVGAGYRDALWPDAPSLQLLDGATGEVATYLINADLHSVWLNSAALRREGFDAHDGVLREADAFEVCRRLNTASESDGDSAVREMAAAAASRGVVGLVDLDFAWNEAAWQRRSAAGFDALHVEFGIYPEHLERAIAEGLRTGDPLRGDHGGLITVGPLKVITDGSLGTRTAACSHAYPNDPHDFGVLAVEPDELIRLMERATGAGIASAIHAIGDEATRYALDAYAKTGAWGTIEHAQLVSRTDIPRFARLGVAASVQPEHALDDRDMTDAVWALQTALPYALRSLSDAGANLRFGSDAPVAALDPWITMAAAVFRTKDSREPWQPGEAVSINTAIAASTHGGSTAPATIASGASADLLLAAADPRSASEHELRAMPVQATLLGGRVTHASA